MRALLPGLAFVLVACATGDPIGQGTGPGTGPGGDGGSSGEGGRTGDGGDTGSPTSGPGGTTSGGSPTGGGAGSTSSTSSGTSSSTSGTPCAEDPCRLVEPQCGCGADEMCTIVDGQGGRDCAPEGTRTPGQQCGTGLGDCEAGALCVYVFDAGETLSCARFCESDAQCDGQGSVCALGLTGVDDVSLCSQNCDLVSSSGCAIAGTKCGAGYDDAAQRNFTVCVGAGTGTAQAICNNETNQCAPGFECLRTNETTETYRCFKWCSTAAPGCPDGLTCQTDFDPPLTVGNVTYGVCSG